MLANRISNAFIISDKNYNVSLITSIFSKSILKTQ